MGSSCQPEKRREIDKLAVSVNLSPDPEIQQCEFPNCAKSTHHLSLSSFDENTFLQRCHLDGIGKKEAIRLFFQGTICPDCCCFVFGKNGCIDRKGFTDWFHHCMDFFALNPSPSVRKFHQESCDALYKEFVEESFGQKHYLSRREFWYVADQVLTKFYVEKSFTESQTEIAQLEFTRRQHLVETFFLRPSPNTDFLIFKYFQTDSQRGYLAFSELEDFVRQAVVFFGKNQGGCGEHTVLQIDELPDVTRDVCLDILKGRVPKKIGFNRFQSAAAELKAIFDELINRAPSASSPRTGHEPPRIMLDEGSISRNIDSSVSSQICSGIKASPI